MNKALSSLSIAMIASAIFAPVVPAHAESDVEIHGFVSQGYIKTTKENQYPVGNSGEGSYNFNDFGINFTRRLAPDLRVGLQHFAKTVVTSVTTTSPWIGLTATIVILIGWGCGSARSRSRWAFITSRGTTMHCTIPFCCRRAFTRITSAT